MTKQEFREFINKEAVILDGATGTNLMAAGMPAGVCPEQWILEHPQAILELQRAYAKAGSRIVYAPTFTANRIKLAEYGLSDRLEEMNRSLVALSREAVGDGVLVAGDLTMTGQQLFPLGELPFEELVAVYREQAATLQDAGVDLFVVETMMSLQECRAALLGIKEVSKLPVMVSLTYNEDGRTLYGTTPEVAVNALQALGADVIGINCSTGPAEMISLVGKMAEHAAIPILAKPNAGMPELDGEQTVYRMTPEEFAEAGVQLLQAGAALLGGCCGTTPAHIRALADAVRGQSIRQPLPAHRRVLTSERQCVEIPLDGGFLVVGERINPTGKKQLQEQLRDGKLELVREMAVHQEACGAKILDINMGMNGIDEKEMMKQVIYEVSSAVDCPLCIDSSHVDVIEAALRIYPGRALINSISMESGKLEQLLPIAKKYGAMFVLLPLSDAGLPKTLEEKHGIIDRICQRAEAEGLLREDIVVDGLVTALGANPEAARECFATIAYCREEKQLPTICGLSNISFGLPERSYVNAAFLTMAIAKGLTMAIANPSQELLMNAAFASDMLLNREDGAIRYIEHMNFLEEQHAKEPQTQPKIRENGGKTPARAEDAANGSEASKRAESGQSHPLFQAVLKGSKGTVIEETKAALAAGESPEAIVNEYLIPAINEVGELFDRKKYFLPQLIGSANTMKLAIDFLEPMMKRDETKAKLPTIVIATVEGDIHDIGKNLVALMLKNHGYHVIDLGKDVPAETIVETAIREQAAVIGLSALMTTTMMRMKEVVALVKERACSSKVIIGGACITQSFADEIGADGFSGDAAECVRVVAQMLET